MTPDDNFGVLLLSLVTQASFCLAVMFCHIGSIALELQFPSRSVSSLCLRPRLQNFQKVAPL